MRRDVFIQNDSRGFSVLAGDAVDAIIEDGRSDDLQFVTANKALLLELHGDDSMPVRVVVDEPLRPDEEAQWLARASWRIDTSDGRMLVMGGLDPDVLSWWKERGNEQSGVGSFVAAPGSWRVDVYAHVGSMNGRVILGQETAEKPGAAFRQSHTGRAFPLWLAKMLEFSDEDPGFDHLWKDVRTSMNAGQLALDMDGGDAIGFLVHVTPFSGAIDEMPESGWFELDHNRRMPATFPLGIPAEVIDPELEGFRDRLLDRRKPEPERPIAEHVVEVIEVWSGDTLKPVDGGSVSLPPSELFLLHWMACLTSDSPPRFELWIEPQAAWAPPAATPDIAVTTKGKSVTAIGAVHNTGGWHTWWTSRDVATAVAEIPDGSTIDFAMAPRIDENDDEERNLAVGRAMYSGKTSGGSWQISEASPRVSRGTLEEAIAFARDVAMNGRLAVRAEEREVFDAVASMYSPEVGSLIWDGDVVRIADGDERTLIMLASPVFRARFADLWPMDVEEELDDED